MADAEKSLLFVIRASIEDYNQKIGEAQRNFQKMSGNIQKECKEMGDKFTLIGGIITGVFVGAIMKAGDKVPELKEKLDTIKGKFDELFATIAGNPAIINLITLFADLLTKAVEWIKQHPELVKAFAAVGFAIAGVGVALKTAAFAMALVKAVSGLGGALQVLAGLGTLGLGMWVFKKMGETPTAAAPDIPAAQHGGIFTRPQLAMIGEAGPEAVMPLSSLGSMGGIGGGVTENHYHFAGFIADDTALRRFVRDIERLQSEETRRSFHKASKTKPYGGPHL